MLTDLRYIDGHKVLMDLKFSRTESVDGRKVLALSTSARFVCITAGILTATLLWCIFIKKHTLFPKKITVNSEPKLWNSNTNTASRSSPLDYFSNYCK